MKAISDDARRPVSPYSSIDKRAFWKTAVTEVSPLSLDDLYRKKFDVTRADGIAAAGSCFAQHITRVLRTRKFNIMDAEPPPQNLPLRACRALQYGVYTARYGNIYTPRQLLQLAQEAFGLEQTPDPAWMKNGRYFDSMRPGVEPEGLESLEEVAIHREHHLKKVRYVFETLDVLVFTLGLTECWTHKATGWAFPTAPGTIAGSYDPSIYAFKNFSYSEAHSDMEAFIGLLKTRNKSDNLRIILTVSPVPLTATYTKNHVAVATTYSKSTLRAVAGDIAGSTDFIDYFPSYEIITSPWSRGIYYDANLRTVSSAGVETVMRLFLTQHDASSNIVRPDAIEAKRPLAQTISQHDEEVACEDALLDAFGGEN